MRYLLTLLCCLLCLFSQPASAQESSARKDMLTQKMHLYKLANPSTTLFLHFDKNIYTNNETAWFTGYVMEENPIILAAHQLLSVALVRNADSVIIKQQVFLINNGLSFGDLTIPDSLLTGSYHFIATTNLINKGKPEAVFIQPVTIKTNIDPTFKAGLKVLEAGKEDKPTQLLLSVTTTDSRFLPGPVQVTYKYGTETKKAITNPSGELLFQVKESPDLSNPNIYVQLKYQKDSSVLQLPLPATTKRKAKVGFYPEGGALVNEMQSQVAWEVKDQYNAAVALKAQLFKDNEVIDTIETNSYGMGRFLLYPEKGSIYSIKLMHTGFAESSYPLPEAIDQGTTLHIKDALPTDTLRLILRSKNQDIVSIRIHNFRETFLDQEIKVNNGGIAIKIPLNDIPKGLKTITLFDAVGRPLAERMIFAHYDPSQKLDISTDQAVYSQRSKVTLTLNLKGVDTLGLVSIACVQSSRLAEKSNTDIESYTYLSKELNELPPGNMGRIYENKDYLTNILLIKGWRKYTWQDLEQVKNTDTIKKYEEIFFPFQVTRNKKTLQKPVSVGMMLGKKLAINKTDEHGHIKFTADDLLVGPHDKIYAFVSEKNQEFYEMKFEDPFVALNKSYLKLFPFETVTSFSTVENNSVLTLKANEKVLRLKEVTITSNKDYLSYSALRQGLNECGDFVCSYNILNCSNHRGASNNTLPVVGRTYRRSNFEGGGSVTYQDCKLSAKTNKTLYPLPAIYTKKEFYSDNNLDPLEPAFFSTLYWNHMVIIPASEAQNLTFYTGDIVGKFKVIVQGISANNMLYGEQTFEVKGKDL